MEIVNFIYTDHVDINENNEHELLAAAHKFELKSLVQKVQLFRNSKSDPMVAKELEHLKLKYDEAKYLFEKAVERHSIRNPFNYVPNRYY